MVVVIVLGLLIGSNIVSFFIGLLGRRELALYRRASRHRALDVIDLTPSGSAVPRGRIGL